MPPAWRTIAAVGDAAAAGITWVGHATALIELDGARLLTDPALTSRLAHLRRHHRPDLDQLGDIDAVLISHVHMDHLHLPSLRLLGPGLRLIVPAGAAPMLRRRGVAAREVVVGDHVAVGAVDVEVVPAVHPGRRGPHSRVRADAVGYVLRGPSATIYFPGDTDLFASMGEFGPVDVALLPIAGWGPTLGEGHLDPDGAARASVLLQPRLVVPIHWGTYSPITGRRRPPDWLQRPAERFAGAMDAAGHGDRLRLLEPSDRLLVPVTAPRPDPT